MKRFFVLACLLLAGCNGAKVEVKVVGVEEKKAQGLFGAYMGCAVTLEARNLSDERLVALKVRIKFKDNEFKSRLIDFKSFDPKQVKSFTTRPINPVICNRANLELVATACIFGEQDCLSDVSVSVK